MFSSLGGGSGQTSSLCSRRLLCSKDSQAASLWALARPACLGSKTPRISPLNKNMAPSSDYSPLLAAEHSDHAAGPHEHVFPPPERATKRSQRRLPRQRPPLWIPDPFSFRSVGSTSPTPDRDGASTDSDSDSGEDTVYGSESEETGSEEKRQAGVRTRQERVSVDHRRGGRVGVFARSVAEGPHKSTRTCHSSCV